VNVGKSIKRCLLNRGQTSYELASQVGVSETHMSRISNQKHCTGEMLEKLSKAFDMSVSEFVALGEE